MTAFRGNRTLADIGEMFGVKAASIQRYEKGRVPRPEILNRIAKVTSKPEKWWIFGDSEANEQVSEPMAPFAHADRDNIDTIKELEALLEVADDDIKQHLRQQIRLLWRAVKTPPKRVQGAG